MTSTYDHRIIQGAESGSFLRRIDQLLQGEDAFYESVAESLGVARERGVERLSRVRVGAPDHVGARGRPLRHGGAGHRAAAGGAGRDVAAQGVPNPRAPRRAPRSARFSRARETRRSCRRTST